MTRPTLLTLVGAAGAGKSTLLAERGYPAGSVVSSDAVRLALTGYEERREPRSRRDRADTRATWDVVYRVVGERLSRGLFTVVDSTGGALTRRGLLRLAARYGVDVELVVLDVPLEVCQARNASRPRVVPPAVVEATWRASRVLLEGWARGERPRRHPVDWLLRRRLVVRLSVVGGHCRECQGQGVVWTEWAGRLADGVAVLGVPEPFDGTAPIRCPACQRTGPTQ